MSDSKPQPAYGKRLLVVEVDNIARTQPQKVFCSFPRTQDTSRGFRDVTYTDFSNSISRAAKWLETTLGGKSSTFETVAYFGVADIRYYIFMLAANKTGHKLLLASPRNSLDGQLSLIDKTDCRIFLRSEGMSVTSLQEHRPHIPCHVVPSLEDIIDPAPVAHYPYTRTFEEAHADPFVVLHSSGTTGLPKPIVSPMDGPCGFDGFNTVPPLDGRELLYSQFVRTCPRHMSAFPFFHSAGIILGLLISVYYGATVVFSHSGRQLSADVIDEIIDHGNISGLMTVPSLLDEMTKDDASLERLSKLNMVLAGAGPLAPAAARLASEKTYFAIVAGATEAYAWFSHTPDREDWSYFVLNEDAAGVEMRLDSDSGLYEKVYVKRPERELCQAIFKTFRDITEYRTNDMFEPHPTKKHTWRLVGRGDDMIVLSNGEKVQPGPIQDIIAEHRAIREAVVIGRGRFQVAVIIELRSYPKTEPEKERLMDDIWPTIEKANLQTPAHGRILREFVLLATPEKPFVRVGKGTITRPKTLELYQPEIDAMYENAETSLAVTAPALDFTSASALQASVSSLCEAVLERSLGATEDFFNAGADSYTTMVLAATIKSSMKSTAAPEAVDKISTRLVYSHPTAKSLAVALAGIAGHADLVSAADTESSIDELVARALRNLDSKSISTVKLESANPAAVLLTGSTGNLGSYILDTLLQDSTISTVYCINRAENGKARQTSCSVSRHLPANFDKAVFIKADLSQDKFGIDDVTYAELTSNVRYIIHSQWPVDFNKSLSTFEPHIIGVANLLKFASPHRTPIVFLSSIASVQNWTSFSSGAVPEQSEPIQSLASSGYGASKLAASLVLEAASAQTNVPSAVLRLGQIAGPRNRGKKGIWPAQEWLPSLLASSPALGALPDSLAGAGRVDWIPVDEAADAIVELSEAFTKSAASTKVSSTEYMHVISPHATSYAATILPAARAYFGQRVTKVTTLDEWVDKLSTAAKRVSSAKDADALPAVKLLEFYQGLARGGVKLPMLSTEKARQMSKVIEKSKVVGQDDVRAWLETWRF